MNFQELLASQPPILVVDDIPSARKVVVKLLEKIGLTKVFEASNGRAALDSVKSNSIKLVISDWEMPQLSGLELLKLVRSEPGFEQMPFIIVTSHGRKEDVKEAVTSGVSDYVLKPFTLPMLKTKIAKAFSIEDLI